MTTEPSGDALSRPLPADQPMGRIYVRVLLIEALVLLALWVLSRRFS